MIFNCSVISFAANHVSNKPFTSGHDELLQTWPPDFLIQWLPFPWIILQILYNVPPFNLGLPSVLTSKLCLWVIKLCLFLRLIQHEFACHWKGRGFTANWILVHFYYSFIEAGWSLMTGSSWFCEIVPDAIMNKIKYPAKSSQGLVSWVTNHISQLM